MRTSSTPRRTRSSRQLARAGPLVAALLALGACTRPTAAAPPRPPRTPGPWPPTLPGAGSSCSVPAAHRFRSRRSGRSGRHPIRSCRSTPPGCRTAGGAIHVVRAEGSGDHPVAGALAPAAWSPVAETLAFAVRDGRGIGLTAAMGQPSDLVLTGTALLDSFAWSPDGNRVAYAVAPGPGGADTLFTVTAGGGRYERAPPPDTGILLAGWEPDGRGVLAWFDGEHSASVAVDGLTPVAITRTSTTGTDLVTSRTYAPWVQWSPDHSRLLVVEGAGREPWAAKPLTLCTVAAAACSRLRSRWAPCRWTRPGRRMAGGSRSSGRWDVGSPGGRRRFPLLVRDPPPLGGQR